MLEAIIISSRKHDGSSTWGRREGKGRRGEKEIIVLSAQYIFEPKFHFATLFSIAHSMMF